MSYPTPGSGEPLGFRPPPRRRPVVGLVVALVVVLGAAVALGLTRLGGHHLAGQAEPAASGQAPPPPAATQPGWTTLTNPAAGLSYQLPPTGWTTRPQVGTAASIALNQGANLTAYVCGSPAEQLLRGTLGSGTAPAVPPAALAQSVAYAAASQFYLTGANPPQVAVNPPQAVRRTTPAGRQVSGVLVRAVAHQAADHCLATEGEVLVLVLRLGDHDGVLVVNGDLAGGPASPPPSGEDQLRKIIGSATPAGG